jgi:hypothetical protein
MCFERYFFQLVVTIILIDITCLKHQGSAWSDDKIALILKNSYALILARWMYRFIKKSSEMTFIQMTLHMELKKIVLSAQ